MKSLLAPARNLGDLNRVDLAVQLLEDEWRRHGDVDLKRLWTEQKRNIADDDEESVILLAEMIKTDLRCRYARGESPSVRQYLETYSELRAANSRVLSLIYEQFCLGEERGDAIDVEAFCDRYPEWKDSLVSQLQYHRLFSQAAGRRPEPPPFPNPGETFEEFRLLSLMGEGGTSRVFLARDLSLGGKRVVLKVSLDRGQEPKAQGALEHPHIVPVNSVVFGDRQLRGLSMPFRPGLPLDVVIKRINPVRRPRRAMVLWQALVEGTQISTADEDPDRPEASVRTADGRATGPRGDGWEGFPVRGTYAQGVAWIVMTLARALEYAHGMRTFHRDVKPGNVLLTLEHGPQLFDFNLAESPHSTTQAEAAMQGGTLPYMAPEQIEAFLDPKLWGRVSAKADIYSLGLVLRELLTGQQPDLPAVTISPQRAMRLLLDRRPLLDVAVSRFNRSIPRALEAILARCLTFSPDDRYPDARALAEDLQRFLLRQPLVHAVNPSRRERIANWTICHGRATIAATSLILIATFPPPDLETSNVFRSAVQAFDNQESPITAKAMDELVEPFDQFVKTYPGSWQPKVYLAFMLSVHDPQRAESLFRQALAFPDAYDNLLAWGKKHPPFAGYLEKFAKDRFEHANHLTKDRPEAGLEEIRQVKKEYISLAKDALRIAFELAPGSDTIVKMLAEAESRTGDYRSADERIVRLIGPIRTVSNPSNMGDVAKLVHPFYIQCQIATDWADDLRTRWSLVEAKELCPRLREAKEVAERLVKHTTLWMPMRLKEQRKSHDNLATVLLALGETEIFLGDLEEAEKNLRLAQRKIGDYERLLDVDNTPESPEDRDRDERIKNAFHRLCLKEVVGAIGGVGLIQALEPPPNASIPSGEDGPKQAALNP